MEKGKNSTSFELKCGVLIQFSFKLGYPNVALYEVTTTEIDEFSAKCKEEPTPVCPPFEKNILNGQWECSLDNKPVLSNTYTDNVQCSLKCDGKDFASVQLICQGGTWKKEFRFGYSDVTRYEVTASQIDALSATCKPKQEDCPPFDTNVLNGQWKCSLDNKPVPSNTFPESVECIFSCQSKDNPTSIVIVCDNGKWKVLQSFGDDSLYFFGYFIQFRKPTIWPH